MPLPPGTRLGGYEILAPLGAGGMGEVYRARDTVLGRDVALKTLPDSVTHDAERLSRFRREAQLLAALNHPHIASIYGVEETGPNRFLVLELVEGETLAARIQRGPLPVGDALAIAREIAEALECAHEKGIVHRDLKPANIALTAQDRVKVLDFGLAKAAGAAAASGTADPVNSPTVTSPALMTGVGVILGTAAYMSPEQARGREADKRSDVWAFGCVLYEMLTGRRAFEGDDVSDTLAAVLRSDPAWDALPRSLSPAVRSLLDGCLEKSHRERIGDMSTVLFVLKHPLPAAAPLPSSSSRSRMRAAPIAVAAAIAGAAAAIALWPTPPPQHPPVIRFAAPLTTTTQLGLARRVLSISPDAQRIVYAADGQLFLRSMNDLEVRPLPGASPALSPAFSPDGQSIVFWGNAALRRVSLTGGTPVAICETAPAPFGIQWSEQGIVFVAPGSGIMRVPASGGTPEMLVRIAPADGLAHGPQLLPDGETLLFTFSPTAVPAASFWDKAEIVAQSLKTGARKTVIKGGSDARYLSTGHLVYMLEGTMMAVTFDLKRLEVTSGAAPIIEGIRRSAPAAGNASQFDVSATGVLAYLPGPARSGQEDVFLNTREGDLTALKLPSGSYAYPRVSPDGKRIALETSDGRQSVISIYDLSGESSLRRLTFGGNNHFPIWSRDGKRVAFQSDREGDAAVFWQPVDGGAAERLTRPGAGVAHVPETWSPTEDLFLFSATKGSESTLWVFSLRDRKESRFGNITSRAFPTDADFSPDGKWIAYQSGDEATGEPSTYVQPFPATGVQHQIGRGGRPMWSPDGKELFLVPAPTQFVVVAVRPEPTFSFGAPTPVQRRFGLAPPGIPRPFDILPDGRIVSVDAAIMAAEQRNPQMHVVLNWFEELKAKLPAAK